MQRVQELELDGKDEAPKDADCRRYAPMTTGTGGTVKWTRTKADDWCSEARPRD